MRLLAVTDSRRREMFGLVFDRLHTHHPEVALFKVDLAQFVDGFPEVDRVAFFLPDDPPEEYPEALAVAAHFEAKGIPIFAHPRNLKVSARKSTFLTRMAELDLPGVVVPRVSRKPLPGYLLRSDLGHTGPLYRPDDPIFHRMQSLVVDPIYIEYIETQDPDGLYRKFRHVSIRGKGLPWHLHVCRDWIARGKHRITSPQTIFEEQTYLTMGGPIVSRMLRPLDAAAAALTLDFAAFDFSFTRHPDRRMVVWEVNQAPLVHLVNPSRSEANGLDIGYRNAATMAVVERLISAITR